MYYNSAVAPPPPGSYHVIPGWAGLVAHAKKSLGMIKYILRINIYIYVHRVSVKTLAGRSARAHGPEGAARAYYKISYARDGHKHFAPRRVSVRPSVRPSAELVAARFGPFISLPGPIGFRRFSAGRHLLPAVVTRGESYFFYFFLIKLYPIVNI